MANRNWGKQRRGRKRKIKPTIFDLPITPFGRVVAFKKMVRFHSHHVNLWNDPAFVEEVRQTLFHPEQVFGTWNRPLSLWAIYKKRVNVVNVLNSSYNIEYIKVILDVRSRPREVKTAFTDDKIKETRRILPKNGNY